MGGLRTSSWCSANMQRPNHSAHVNPCEGGRISVLKRNNVVVKGDGDRTIVFAHGFGCDQNMWRLVAPAFETDFTTVTFDHVGAGGSDLSAYSSEKYATL